jgi:hypothetical protein
MKSVLRSPLDPLPRSISTPVLVLLVGVVVFGTAITVRGYLQSSEPVVRHLADPASATGRLHAEEGAVWASEEAPEARVQQASRSQGIELRSAGTRGGSDGSMCCPGSTPAPAAEAGARASSSKAPDAPASVFQPASGSSDG